MLRRIVLTAFVSAAALAAAVPAAGASPLPLPLPLPLLSAQAPAGDQLTVTVSDTARTDGLYELRCGPTGGDHPAAQAACDRLDELAQQGDDPFAPVPQDQMCTEQMGGPETAHVTGTWQGRQVDATFSRTNGCEISRWQTMEPVLPNTRS
ncbi:subtilisin inhibitor-like [Streptomyces sp. SLBN-118]|uniref:SSI family serine proteinase inhibitor n=1 Tax=Streptomyces sp. SLBN-118 TaxID=2768454 RepID=UPI001151D9EA|nr:SSI family serine proteinase inhibitor [Streptomyces sp. SLBN-118]TQK53173.1 subtilisin inhibitor-like [Streptomyces sp. SLBN-118]